MTSSHKQYKLTTVDTNMFLGIHIRDPDNYTLKLSQSKYARKLIKRHGLKDYKSVNKPHERLCEPNASKCSKQQLAEFKSINGGLQYLANNTRPDISHAINHLARFLVNPSGEHILAARRVICYITKDPDKGISLRIGPEKPRLEVYSDSVFAGDPLCDKTKLVVVYF